ncbi:co-chaperone YbbN [Mycoplasma marinum]|uniref:Thioredoxin n=1 Tax=Mycoplasma marinum TaxID=1937190 RepID=A0A4R0XUX5_9MOLU|nr:thioredoxin family protein [Mycoplasma marinum]TCG11617.1 thioredoxin [Mycoplasma marinum]
MKDLTLKEFEQIKNNKGVVIVDFYTTWCGDCHMMKPVFDNLANEYEPKGVNFVTVDAEKNSIFQTSGGYDVLKVPTFIVFKDGKEVDRGVEYQPIDLMKEWLDKAL